MSDSIDYSALIKQHPWITERDQNCVLSPDSDGLLCGLLVSHYLGWNIKGFYDGKVLIIEKGVRARDCIFLDVEIFREGVKSIGQHMLMYDKKNLPTNWNNFKDAIAANNLRGYDFKNDFKLKYPFGTIHLLLSILAQKQVITINKDAISPLLYTDGTFKNQFNYPENCISWLEFLVASGDGSPLQKIFLDKHYSVYELMTALSELFAEIAVIGGGKRGGDKIKISDSKGRIVNIDEASGTMRQETIQQAKIFLGILAKKTGWAFDETSWCWGPYDIAKFKKGSAKPGKARYNALLEQNPLSLAIISGMSIEYTLDPDNQF
jgi:hypothetical protein